MKAHNLSYEDKKNNNQVYFTKLRKETRSKRTQKRSPSIGNPTRRKRRKKRKKIRKA